MSLEQVDVDWAWAAFEPSSETPWDLRAAAHLYRRAGFGANWSTLQAAIESDPADVVTGLMRTDEPEDFRDDMSTLLRAALATGNVQQLAAQWVYRILNTPRPLTEKMTLFWHGHFATSAAKVEDAGLMQQQNDLLRANALGDFHELLLEISRDPAMLLYLDSASNRKSHPNENYAREIMELFSLGEGNYSESDIRELARCFTGWEIKRKKFRFNRYQHDSGVKRFLGAEGHFGGEDAVGVVASHEATPGFLVRKFLRFFLSDDLHFSDDLIEPLVNQLKRDGLRVAPTVQRILSSNLFFSPYCRAGKIRSPVEFGVGLLLALDGTTDCYKLASEFHSLGQGLYMPPSVKGWDGGRDWINSSTLLGRANLVQRLVAGEKTRFAKQTLSLWVSSNGVSDPSSLVDRLSTLLAAVDVPQRFQQQVVELADREPDDWAIQTTRAFCALPEFHLS